MIFISTGKNEMYDHYNEMGYTFRLALNIGGDNICGVMVMDGRDSDDAAGTIPAIVVSADDIESHPLARWVGGGENISVLAPPIM